MRSQNGVTAAIDETEHIVSCDFLTKANATGAEDAAFVIERDTGPDFDPLWLFDFVFQETRIGPAIFNAEFLETTLTGLIANRAIERMIDEQKFHHAAPAFLSQR